MSKRAKNNFAPPFWKTKSLDQMSPQEWESLCDGCAKCCLHQLQDIKTDTLAFTDIRCELLDDDQCRCINYQQRKVSVPSCMVLTPENIAECAQFAPPTCAYRLLYYGEELPAWHPLVSGDPDSVHEAGMSVRGRTRSESSVNENREEYIVAWPEYE